MEDPFDHSKVTPQYWYNCSSDLRGSAAALLAASAPELSAVVAHKFGLGAGFSIGIASSAVYEMLCGMSIELMLKAIAVAQRKKVLGHHRLIDLARYVDVSLAPDEEALLAVLTGSIRWAGRYPVPKGRKEWEATGTVRSKALWEPVDASPDFKRDNGALDWKNVNALWIKLREVYCAHHLTFRKNEAQGDAGAEGSGGSTGGVEWLNPDYEPPNYDHEPPDYGHEPPDYDYDPPDYDPPDHEPC